MDNYDNYRDCRFFNDRLETCTADGPPHRCYVACDGEECEAMEIVTRSKLKGGDSAESRYSRRRELDSY